MANPTESALGSTAADALSGTTSPNAQFIHCTIDDEIYYTEDFEKEAIMDAFGPVMLSLQNTLGVSPSLTVTVAVVSPVISISGGCPAWNVTADSRPRVSLMDWRIKPLSNEMWRCRE